MLGDARYKCRVKSLQTGGVNRLVPVHPGLNTQAQGVKIRSARAGQYFQAQYRDGGVGIPQGPALGARPVEIQGAMQGIP